MNKQTCALLEPLERRAALVKKPEQTKERKSSIQTLGALLRPKPAASSEQQAAMPNKGSKKVENEKRNTIQPI